MSVRLLAVLLFSLGAFAQDYRGKIQGFVTDASNATVAGARITLLNTGTGVSSERETTANGAYLFDNVEPGTYNVTVELQGFSKQVQENVLVQTRADVTVNFSLKPGAVVETVTVEASAVTLQFNTSTRELTIDRKMLMDLPVKARNPFTLALLDPAVVNRYTAERNPFFMWSSSQMDVGGNTSTKNDLVMDGAPIQVGPKGSYSPPMDATQEFSVQQNSVDAEFGHSAGGILSVGTKSGTNEIHGTAYYFGRNPAFNAILNPTNRTPNFVRNHIYGGTIGAPIKKNRLFNFFSYENWHTKEPRDAVRTMPTDLERTGNFSASRTRAGNLRTIYDPTTTILDVATNTASRMPFPNNVIPGSRIDPTAARIMQDVWGPNNPGDDAAGSNNFKSSYAWPMTNWNVNNRTDWNISDKLKVFGRYSQFRTTLDQENYTPNNSRAMPNDNGGIMNSRNIVGDVVYTMSPTTVINLRGSYSSLEDDYSAPEYAVGEEGLSQFWPNNPWYKPYLSGIPLIYYPYIGINNIGNANFSFGKSSYWFQHPRQTAVSGKISHARGSHYLKAGAEYRHHVGEGVYPNLMNFNFYPHTTANTYLSPNTANSGDPWASFLIGALDDTPAAPNPQNASAQPYVRSHIPYIGIFVHDDWKITRRITLNLGLRYEWESGPYDESNQYSRYLDLDAPNQMLQQNTPQIPSDLLALSTPKWNGQWIFTDDANRKAFTTQKSILLPRIGAAIRVNDKTAVNIGWARYVVPISTIARTLARCEWCWGFSQTSNPLLMVEGRPQAFLSNPFPAGSNPVTPVVGTGAGVNTNLGNTITTVTWPTQDFKAQINDRINLTIMRELPGQFKVDGTLFMNIGRYVPVLNDELVNMMDPNLSYTYKADLSRNVPNPFYQYGTPETFGALRNQRTVTRASLLRPYPQYGELTVHNVGTTRARYWALQLRVQRSYASGGTILVAYNYNQERQEAYFNDPQRYSRQFFWLPSNNARHRLTMAGSYDLPFGRGKKFGSDMNRVLDGFIGGWQLSGIFTYRSGEFLRFPGADVIGEPNIDNPGPNAWFNIAAFRPQTAFTPRLNPWQYSDITGPIFWNTDANLAKSFMITERFRLEFRLEAYNLTNSLMWANPNMTVGNATFGRSTTQANQNRGREIQYTARFHF
jgi:hypothetical protein